MVGIVLCTVPENTQRLVQDCVHREVIQCTLIVSAVQPDYVNGMLNVRNMNNNNNDNNAVMQATAVLCHKLSVLHTNIMAQSHARAFTVLFAV